MWKRPETGRGPAEGFVKTSPKQNFGKAVVLRAMRVGHATQLHEGSQASGWRGPGCVREEVGSELRNTSALSFI